jgi:bis(5'-adenosyl)-triphosphatase
LKPIVPGHCLVIPKRVVKRFPDLTPEEVTDLWLSAQKIAPALEKFYNCTATTYAIQDGKDAGQTVEHVHIHIIPRRPGDFKRNDDVYNEIENDNRKPRTEEEMAEEARTLAKLFPDNQ